MGCIEQEALLLVETRHCSDARAKAFRVLISSSRSAPVAPAAAAPPEGTALRFGVRGEGACGNAVEVGGK
jgi:hypothetical protein